MTNTYTPQPGSNAAALVQTLRARQVAMRTDELASICGIESGSVQATLVAAVNAGVVTCCKVTSNGRQVNEYRIGSGMVPRTHAGEYKPPKATILPVRQGETKVIDAPAPKRTARPQPIYPAAPDQSIQAQPAVANNTGSDPQETTSSPAAVVVAATAATPVPKSKLRESGPASIKVPAGNVDSLYASIDSTCVLVIGTRETVIELQPDQILALGDFLNRTEPLWRP